MTRHTLESVFIMKIVGITWTAREDSSGPVHCTDSSEPSLLRYTAADWSDHILTSSHIR